MTKAISLFSGGLDSMLAAKIVADLGVEVELVHFSSVFFFNTMFDEKTEHCYKLANDLGLKLTVIDISLEITNVIKNPRYGYGKNMNPCIDCHTFMVKKSVEYMKKVGADFIITGEVLNERPMSQTKTSLGLVEKRSQSEGFLLRPLSAKLLKPTVVEQKGLIDREKLYAIRGRSRKPQIELAEKLGIKEYSQPAGGCMLTEKVFSSRLRDVIDNIPNFSLTDINFLKIGRHFRISPRFKLIVGRDEKENDLLLNMLEKDDICFHPSSVAGPIAVGRGVFTREDVLLGCSIVARYSDKENKDSEIEVSYNRSGDEAVGSVTCCGAGEEQINKIRI